MVLICNNRDAVLKTLHELDIQPDPVSMMRLARLRGQPGLDQQQLQSSSLWQRCQAAVSGCLNSNQFSV